MVEAEGTRPDRGPDKVEWARFLEDAHVADGNYVVIEQGHGEWSSLLHLKQGSLRVGRGQRVRRGEPIGQMGFSGDAMTVHVHHRLQGGASTDVEGLPAIFSGFRRVLGLRSVPVRVASSKRATFSSGSADTHDGGHTRGTHPA